MKRQKIRVLLVGPTSPPYAGIEAATESLLAGLEVTGGVLWRHLNTQKPVPNALRGRFTLTNLMWACRHVLRMMWLCISFRPDIIHLPIAHNRLGFLRDACLVACGKLVGARLLLQAHNDSYDKFVLSQPAVLRGAIVGMYRLASVIAVQGASLRGQFDRLGLGQRVLILTNHLEIAKFRRACRDRRDSEPLRVLLLGRVSIAKGAWDLARAAAEASRRVNRPIDLVLTGEVVANDASVAHLADKSRHVPTLIRGLLGNGASALQVSYVGVLDESGKLRELGKAHVLALPSYSEALPYAVLEGAAGGLPILATDVGMIPELRHRGLRGVFVRPGDLEGLTTALVALMDPIQRAADGSSNAEFAEREFDQALLPERLTSLYEHVMRRGAGIALGAL